MNAPPETQEVGFAIEMVRLCRILNVLPYAGGLYEQPWIVVEFMKLIISAQNDHEKREGERSRGA